MIRSFIALPVPEDAAAALESWTNDGAEILWTNSDNYHITLAFLGDVHPATLADYDAALVQTTSQQRESITIRIDARGWFGGETPRNLFARVAANPALAALRGKVLRALESAGFEHTHDAYRPHVTLARPAKRDAAAALAWATAPEQIAPVCWEATWFALYRSELTPTGPLYTELARYPL